MKKKLLWRTAGILVLTILLQCKSRSPETHSPPPENTVSSATSIASPLVLKRLKSWQDTRPVTGEIPIHVVYWSPKGRLPLEGYEQRINSVMFDMQELFRTEMERMGYGPISFHLDTNDSDRIKIHVVESQSDLLQQPYRQHTIINDDVANCLAYQGVDTSYAPSFVFINISEWEQKQRDFSYTSPTFSYYSDYYFSTNSGVVDSKLLSSKLPSGESHPPFIETKYEGLIFSTPLESYRVHLKFNLAKHIGYTLGLPFSNKPNKHKAPEFLDIMDYTSWNPSANTSRKPPKPRLSETSALMLASHTNLTGSTKGIRAKIFPNITNLRVTKSPKDQIKFSGVIDSSIPAYALIFELWSELQDGATYPFIESHSIVIQDDNSFKFTLPKLTRNSRHKLIIAALYVNGWSSNLLNRQTGYKITFNTDENGIPDLYALQDVAALTQLGLLINADDYSGVLQEHDRLKKMDLTPRALEVAKSLTQSFFGHTPSLKPSQIPPENRSIPLSHVAAESFTSGWKDVLKDRLPTSSGLIVHNAELYTHSIHAHANSTGVYHLNKGWKRFTGLAAIVEGMTGLARFTIKGDGKVLWQTGVVHHWTAEPFNIDITGVDVLEIIATHEPGRKSACWTTWLEPTLLR